MTVGTKIDPNWAWDDRFPLAQGIKLGNLLYISGQVAVDPDGNIVGKGDIKAQTRKVFENIEAILRKSGGTLDNLINITTYLTDIKLFEGYNDTRAKILKDLRPTSTTVAVSGLAFEGLLVEINGVAYL